jgi:hypothetical protein
MYALLSRARVCALLAVFVFLAHAAVAQSFGGVGTVSGTVTDPTGAVVPGATVEIKNPVTNYDQKTITDNAGQFAFHRVPLNNYHVSVSANGFSPVGSDIDVRSTIPISMPVALSLATANTTVTVEGGSEDMVETTPSAHTDIDNQLIQNLPISNSSSGLSSVITLATPGVVSDSNGMFHPLGEHADTTFSIDGQPISDQQSRTFSNQLSPDTVRSMEVITGVPPAEYGDKASLVVEATTKSGMGVTRPTGSINTSYGSFGTSNVAVNMAVGGKKWGNFFSLNGLNTGRFLDTPEFDPLHAHGNSESFFNHLDYQLSDHDLFHLNLSVARSWFQIPNTYDQQFVGQDQRELEKSFNIAPSYSHQFTDNLLLTVGAFVRQDRVGYFPSANLLSDQPATLSQTRRLTNTGIRTDLSYVKGRHNIKGGVQFSHTLLSEAFQTGLTDPLFNSPCLDASGLPVAAPGIMQPSSCSGTLVPNAGFAPGLLPFDLTRGGHLFTFRGSTDIKEEAAYIQDSINLSPFTLSLGLRGDNYNGLSSGSALQPRMGVSYNIKKTGTVLRASYGRIFLTPYNENLILSSMTGSGGLATGVFGAFGETALTPAKRNQYDVGFEQPLDRHLVLSAEYFWKFTTGDYDFDTLFNTPLAFPIQWQKSKIDGLAVRLNFPVWHGLTWYSVMGHTRARFFGPEIGGLLFNSPLETGAFRIDHDQAFEQNTHFQYQPKKDLPWFGLTWTYQSGMVAGAVPDFATALTFSADQQAQIGLFCGSTFATVTMPIRNCSSPNFGATRLNIPAAGTENPDTNPPRVAPRNLFDASVGFDNIFHGDRYKWDLKFTALNLTNKVALYNFLSTFSGTHFVAPRTVSAELTLRF